MSEGIKNRSMTSTAEPETAVGKVLNQKRVPDHAISLPGGNWTLWRWAVLRGAGFPVEGVLELSAPRCGVSADDAIRAEEYLREARARALDAVNDELDALRSNNRWDDRQARDLLVKAMRLLKMGKLPDPLHSQNSSSSAIENLRIASRRANETLTEFKREFELAVTQLSKVLYDIAGREHFREAITWQNRRAIHTALDILRSKPFGAISRRSKQRQHEELIANYVQRYCVKNDTIGFFGPVGWAKIVSDELAIVVRAGSSLLAKREVYFESWCIDALGQKLTGDKRMRPWLRPRRMPYIRIEANTLHLPLTPPSTLSRERITILRLCDGKWTAKNIASEMVNDASLNLSNEEEVYAILSDFEKSGLISWGFEMPVKAYPEHTLRLFMESIDDSIRIPTLQAIDELEAKRAEIERAAGNAQKLDEALQRLEEAFTRLTGVASTRGHGELYAGRTLVYEDCRRDVSVEIGTNLLRVLGPPLSLLLHSARWFTYAVSLLCYKSIRTAYDELVRETGSPVIEAIRIWLKIRPIIYRKSPTTADRVLPIFQDMWSKILSVPEGRTRVHYTCEELRPKVMAAFNAPHPGWKVARYHSPDIMIAAPSVEAIERGDYQLVMGEMHLATNTIGASLFLEQHPYREEVVSHLDIDFPEPRLVPVTPKNLEHVTTRTISALFSPKDIRLALTQDSVVSPEIKSLPISEMVVEDIGGKLVIRTRDGKVRFDVIEAVGDILSTLTINNFKPFPLMNHTPRISFDRLVVCRESWSFPPSALKFAFEKDEAACFLGARRWAREQAIPRHAFAKVPVELKPLFVDFDSPSSINIVAKMIRRSVEKGSEGSMITISEMLPNTQETWLQDAEGLTYTSEIRFVARDTFI